MKKCVFTLLSLLIGTQAFAERRFVDCIYQQGPDVSQYRNIRFLVDTTGNQSEPSARAQVYDLGKTEDYSFMLTLNRANETYAVTISSSDSTKSVTSGFVTKDMRASAVFRIPREPSLFADVDCSLEPM